MKKRLANQNKLINLVNFKKSVQDKVHFNKIGKRKINDKFYAYGE
jgi:hypothetical protein